VTDVIREPRQGLSWILQVLERYEEGEQPFDKGGTNENQDPLYNRTHGTRPFARRPEDAARTGAYSWSSTAIRTPLAGGLAIHGKIEKL